MKLLREDFALIAFLAGMSQVVVDRKEDHFTNGQFTQDRMW